MPPVRQATTVEGTWVDPNGITSTFSGGTFNTRTTDTNQLLASGTYTSVSDRLVEINMTSLVRNTQSKGQLRTGDAQPAELHLRQRCTVLARPPVLIAFHARR
jgi:hypothetical protein